MCEPAHALYDTLFDARTLLRLMAEDAERPRELEYD